MSNVVDLPVITKLDCDPDRILARAQGQLSAVIVIGYDKDEEEYFASSYADGGSALWLLERMKMKLLAVPDEQ